MTEHGANEMGLGKHIKLEAGDGNGTPRGVRVTVAGAVGLAISLLTLGGTIVGISRATDPAVSRMKFDALAAEMHASDAALAVQIQKLADVMDQRLADNDKTRAFWVQHFQEKDEEAKEETMRARADMKDAINDVRARVAKMDDKLDRLLDAGVVPRPR